MEVNPLPPPRPRKDAADPPSADPAPHSPAVTGTRTAPAVHPPGPSTPYPGSAAPPVGRPVASAPLAHGAEAVLVPVLFLGRSVLAKRRDPKPYRHPALDARLRDERTRDEARLLLAARAAGVPVPILYDVDRAGALLCMEAVPGPSLRDQLPRDDDAHAAARMRHLGALTARLHDAGLVHGDLTTSNLLVPDPRDPASLVFIDFGLGAFTPEAEDRAVDLHLMEEALVATEPRADALVAALLDGYRAAAQGAATLRRLEAVRERGRYRGAA